MFCCSIKHIECCLCCVEMGFVVCSKKSILNIICVVCIEMGIVVCVDKSILITIWVVCIEMGIDVCADKSISNAICVVFIEMGIDVCADKSILNIICVPVEMGVADLGDLCVWMMKLIRLNNKNIAFFRPTPFLHFFSFFLLFVQRPR